MPHRSLLGGIIKFLQLHAEDSNLSFIITPDLLQKALTPRPHDLPAAAAAAEAARQDGATQAAEGTGTGLLKRSHSKPLHCSGCVIQT